jgi:DNA polymerase I
MDFELHPLICLGSRTFHVLVAPVQMLVGAMNAHLDMQRFKVLYVCGNYSRILSSLDRGFTSLEIRRAFTAFQLMTILEENHHTLLIIEHDPLLYEDAAEMVEYAARALKEASNNSVVLLYAPASDPHLEEMIKYADRVFCFAEGPRPAARPNAKNGRKTQAQAMAASQTTFEAF